MTRNIAKLAAVLALLSGAVYGVPAAHAQARSQAADCSTSGQADVNGDGFDDLVAGDPFADVGGQEGAGAVHILLGGGDGPGTGGTMMISAPDGKAGDGFGWAVRTAHIDEDRCLDIVVGAPYADVGGKSDAGAAYVFAGVADGTPKGSLIERPAANQEKGAHFGWSLAAVDGQGDEVPIVAVGAPHEDAEGVRDAGAVYLRYPGQGGEPKLTHLTQGNEGVIGNSEPGDAFGWSLAFGRLGGNAVQMDLAVGTPYENIDGVGQQNNGKGVLDVGSVNLVYDVAHSADGTYSSGKWELRMAAKSVPARAGDRFGHALDYAEWKGEGFLAVSAPGADSGNVADSGLVQLFKRGVDGKFTPQRTVRLGVGELKTSPATKRAFLGWSLAFWNPRDTLVLAIGSPFESFRGNPTPESGVVREIVVTQSEGADLVAERPEGALPYEHFGWSVTDFGGADGVTPGNRLVVGVPDERSSGGGAVAVMEGASPRLFTPGRITDGAAADFGSSIG